MEEHFWLAKGSKTNQFHKDSFTIIIKVMYEMHQMIYVELRKN